jgi:hypothetical protein
LQTGGKSAFEPAFDFVADDAFAYFFAYRKPDLQAVCLTGFVDKHDMFGGNTLPGIVYVTEFFVSLQRIASVQIYTSIQQSMLNSIKPLCGQNLPAFGAPAF